MRYQLRCLVACLVYAASANGIATPPASPNPPRVATACAEVARGAACVGAAIRARYSYDATRRLIRNCVEENLQRRHDSDGFRLGVHMSAAYWTLRLPEDVPGRATAIAQHRDIVKWLLPRVGVPAEEVTHTTVSAAGLPDTAEQQLLELLRAAH